MKRLFKKFYKKYKSNRSTRYVVMTCPLAFAEVGVKSRVKSVLNYKKPTIWIIIVGIIACLAISVFFLTNPKYDNDKAVGVDIMSKTICFTSEKVYFWEPVSTSYRPDTKFAIKNGYLYKNESYDYIGLLMPIDLTKDNFDSIIISSPVAMGQLDSINEDNVLFHDVKEILENIRVSCKNAWFANGELGIYLLLEVNEEVFYIASCDVDEQGNIVSYDNLVRLKAVDVLSVAE